MTRLPAAGAFAAMTAVRDPVDAFLDAAFWHGSIDRANALLAAHPGVATASIHTAATLGDEAGVRAWLARDPAHATARGGPHAVDPLTCACFSVYLQHDAARSAGLVRTAAALLDAGASAHSGFFDPAHRPAPEWESVLYGAAGVAHHAAMTRLLLQHGADPNDAEVVYHAPETYDNAALELLVGTGALTADSLVMMLVRKLDWHDAAGVRHLLEHGADANRARPGGGRPLHHAIRRDNARDIVVQLLDRGADPASEEHGRTAAALAARRGRGDLLAELERRGAPAGLRGADCLVALCARQDRAGVAALAAREPQLVDELRAEGATLLAEFAGTGNAAGVALLLSLDVPVDSRYGGDAYFQIPAESTALHVAAWRARHDVVRLLIARGAAVNSVDGQGRTPLSLAVAACVDSYWSDQRAPDSVAALLAAGASADGIAWPTGYPAVDDLLRPPG